MSVAETRAGFDRMYDAWRRTQPQTFIDFAALDEQPAPTEPLTPPSCVSPPGLLVEGCVEAVAGSDGSTQPSTVGVLGGVRAPSLRGARGPLTARPASEGTE